MAGNSIGDLYYGLGLDDTEFNKKLKAISAEKLMLNAQINYDSITKSIQRLSSMGKTLVINPVLDKDKVTRIQSQLDSIHDKLKQQYDIKIVISETDAKKSLDSIKKNVADTINELKKYDKIRVNPIDKSAINAIRDLVKELKFLESVLKRVNALNMRNVNQSAVAGARVAEIQARQASRASLDAQRIMTEQARAQRVLANATTNTANAQRGLNQQFTLQGRIMSNLKTLATTYVSIFAVKSFIQNLARVRGEFELQQVSLRAILRDAEAADKIFGQIKAFSVISPFEFKDLVGYAKQLSAFQVPVNELFDTTKRLADVSAGLGVSMDRITLAYGQIRAAGVLRGTELRQLTEAGIPAVDELAKKFSELEGRVVSAGDVFEKISNRMVSFEMVKEIFEDMTNEGGMFYMMQEKQAESLKGKIANLADAYSIMLNDIGEANDGILKGGVEGIASLMQNWENVWSILKTIIAGYGMYKAAIIALIAIEKVHIGINMSGNLALTAKNLGIVISNLGRFQEVLKTTGMSAKAFHAAIGGIVGVLTVIGVAIYEVIQNSNRLSNELNKISNTEFSSFKQMSESLQTLGEKLKNTVQGSQEHRDLIKQINNVYGEYLPFVLNEITALDAVANSTNDVIEAMKKRKMMMSQEKGEQAIEEEYGSDLADARKDLSDFLVKYTKSKADAISIIGLIEKKIKETEGAADVADMYKLIKDYFGKNIITGEFANKGFIDNFVELNVVMRKIIKSEKELADQNSITFGTSFNTRQARLEFEKLEASYSKMRDELKKKPLDKDAFEEELAKINKQEQIAKINFKIQFDGLSLEKAQEQIKALEEISVNWKEVVKETIGKNKAGFIFKVGEGEDQFDYLDRLDKEYKKLTSQQELIDKKLVTSPVTIEATKTQLDLLNKIGKALNYNFKVDVKAGAKEENPRIQLLNKELDLIKKAKDEYDKLAKWQSQMAANQNIKTIYGIDFNEKDAESRAKDIISKIFAISKKEGEKSQFAFDKWFMGDNIDEIINNLKKTFDAISKQIETYKDKFNFYEQILNLGGTEEMAISFSGIESGNLVEELKKMTLKAVQEVRPTITIETVLDQKDLPEQVQKLVDAANKAVDEAKKNSLLSAAKLLTMESPEGMGMSFDLGNVVKKYSVELLKLQNELRSALSAEGLTEEQKKQIQSNQKLAIDANTKIYADKAKKSGAVYVQEQIEIAGLGEAFKNMSTASYEGLLKMLEITEKAKKDLLSGADAVSGLKNAGFKEEDASRLASEEPIFASLFNSEDLEEFQLILEEIDTLLNSSDTVTITSKLGIKPEDIDKLKLWIAQQKGAALAVGNTNREINKFRIDKIVKMLDDLGKNLDSTVDGIRNLASAFGRELDSMTSGALDLLSTIVSSTTNAISTIVTTQQAAATAMEGASTAAATAIKTVERASVILAIIGAVLQVATKVAGMFSKNKDLEEEIKNSEIRLQKLKNLYSEIERIISRNLGGAQNVDLGLGDTVKKLEEINKQIDDLKAKSKKSVMFYFAYSSNIQELEKEQKRLQAYLEGGAYAVQRQNLIEQQEELRKQINAERADKDTDEGKIADWENQIKELDDTIRHLAQDTLKSLYDIDLKDWAAQIGDSLVEAFSKGEDAAEAFDSTIGEIMRNVVKKMISLNVLEPMFEKLRTYLFGSDGKSGAFGGDFKLDAGEVAGMKTYIDEIKNKGIPSAEALYDAINDMLGGIMDVSDESKKGLSEGIKGITEDTADILASYANSIRGSVLLQETYMRNIDANVLGIYKAMGGSASVNHVFSLRPEVLALLLIPMQKNSNILKNIDLTISDTNSIAANSLAQLVRIQANTFNIAMEAKRSSDAILSVIAPGHPKGGSGVKIW